MDGQALALQVVGLNHHTAPVALRERLAWGPDRLPEVLARLQEIAAEALVLSTCNRTEVYALGDPGGADGQRLIGFLAGEAGLPVARIAPHLFTETGQAAVRHLFGVVAGLDSLVVGEDQILAQVKGALDGAQAAGALGPALYRLGHLALATGKAVRSETAINRHHLSVVSVALDLAARQLGGVGAGAAPALAGRAVLILGAGQIAELTLKHLAGARDAARPARVTLLNRTYEHAATLAGRHGATARPWADLEATLHEADVVISCTGSPLTVLSAELLARVLAARAAGRSGSADPLLCLDLAVPRDVDPAVAGLPGVALYDMDALQAICATNREERTAEVAQAAALVDAGVERYMAWWQARAVAPTVAALRAQAEAIRDAEVARTLARLPGLSEPEQAAVRYLGAALVNKLLHQPVTALKAAPDPAATAGLVCELFGLDCPGGC